MESKCDVYELEWIDPYPCGLLELLLWNAPTWDWDFLRFKLVGGEIAGNVNLINLSGLNVVISTLPFGGNDLSLVVFGDNGWTNWLSSETLDDLVVAAVACRLIPFALELLVVIAGTKSFGTISFAFAISFAGSVVLSAVAAKYWLETGESVYHT